MKENKIYNGDCIELMKKIKDKSIDMILCDLPYGTTRLKWDSIIPFDQLWEQYERIITDNGAIVLTASQPFTSALAMSNPKLFRYEWIWEKNNNTNFANAKKMPMKRHENILVFYKHLPTYNPQGLIELNKPKTISRIRTTDSKRLIRNDNFGLDKKFTTTHTNYPDSILNFSQPSKNDRIHPTQKPLDLWEYLIKTYTNDGDLILDNTSGSGVTAIAAMNTNRNFICMELDKEIYENSIEYVKSKHNNWNN